MTETPDFTTARLEGIACIQAFVDSGDLDAGADRIRELITGSDHAAGELLIALSGLTAAMIEQVAPLSGITPTDYLDRLRQGVLALADPAGGEA